LGTSPHDKRRGWLKNGNPPGDFNQVQGMAGSLPIEEAPEIYFRPPYVGPSGWVGVELSRVGIYVGPRKTPLTAVRLSDDQPVVKS
jgi:hypothetical protein